MAGIVEGKRVFLTGGGGNLGSATAKLLATEGASVAVVDISLQAAEDVVAEINSNGGIAIAIQADVRNDNQIFEAVAESVGEFGGLDTLINNAGIMPHQDASMLDADLDEWRAIYELNTLGTVTVSRHVVPHIKEAGGGSVINMSSFLAVIGCSYPQDAYTSSKGALSALTRSMSAQFGPHNIRVNAMAPGPILTAHVEQFFPDPAARALRLARVPLGRFGKPDDVAGLATFLTSEWSSWISGQVITLDGGISINYV